jgi:hypothetical protein
MKLALAPAYSASERSDIFRIVRKARIRAPRRSRSELEGPSDSTERTFDVT